MNVVFGLIGLYLYVGAVSVLHDFTRLRGDSIRAPGYVLHPDAGSVLFAVLLWPYTELFDLRYQYARMTCSMRVEVLGSLLVLLLGAVLCAWGFTHIMASDAGLTANLSRFMAILVAFGMVAWWLQSLKRSRPERWSRR